jgi:tellurite methyltransferase
MSDFSAFFEATFNAPHAALIDQALPYCHDRGTALDLGCGAGRNTRYLLKQGFAVTAVDSDPSVLRYLQTVPQERLNCVITAMEAFPFASYDFILACYALPFLARPAFDEVLGKIARAMVPGGVFAGEFFGIHDSGRNQETATHMTFLTRAEAEAALTPWQIRAFQEEDKAGQTATGKPKHWHVFHFIVQS